MHSIITGYEYDIFISYRHNDNRSGWVTEFVKALQDELAATIKEPLSIYFDSNPYDGLLETHDVDGSLKEKVKCLVFIPIVSQTYCDPKSFAWQYEFCAFNKLAQVDQLGRDIKLNNGNVASRILPIKIHELDADDKSAIENEIGGVLRAIEFIYKSGGVNRPLNSKDDEVRTPGKILYRDQVNKVANAVKEMIVGVKSSGTQRPGTIEIKPQAPTKSNKKALMLGSLAILLIALAGYFLYPKLLSSGGKAETLDKSIAVLPFVDMSPNKDQEYLGDGIAEEILNVLARVKDLKVIGRTSSFSYKGKGIDLKTIGEELGVSTILEGSIRKDGNKIRVTAQFIKASDGSHLWSESFDRELKDIFQIQDELSRSISKSLLTSFEDPVSPTSIPEGPSSNEAYNLYLLGKYQFDLSSDTEEDRKESLYESIKFFKRSIKLDSSFANTYSELARSYIFFAFYYGEQEIDNIYDLAELSAKKCLELDEKNVLGLIDMALIKRNRDWDWEAARNYFHQAKSIAPNYGYTFGLYSMLLSAINQTDSALFYSKKAVDLDPNSGLERTYAMRVPYYARQFDVASSLWDGIKQNGRTGREFLIRILSHTNKDRAVSMLLNDCQLDEPVKKELEMYYHKNGWNALMTRLFTTYIDKLTNSTTLVLLHGAPKDGIFEKLNTDADNRVGSMVYLLIDPVYDPIRSDPRYDALLKRMGLDKYK